MFHKHCIEACDKSLGGIMSHHISNNTDLPFRGKLIVLGGDFRQIQSIVLRRNRLYIVFASNSSSYLWKHHHV